VKSTKICSICRGRIIIHPDLWKDTPGNADVFCSPECIVKAIRNNSDILDISERKATKKPIVSEFYLNYSTIIGKPFRSEFEVLVAEYFTKHKLEYLYESVTLELFKGTRHWTPDFYFPEYSTFVEVKGVWALGGRKKFNEAVLTIDEPIILIPYWMKELFRKELKWESKET